MAEPVLVALSLILLLVFTFYKYLTWHWNVWRNLGLPGPKPKLLFGNFPTVITGKRHVIYDIDDVYNQYKKSHGAIGVFMTRNPEILILDPKLVNETLVTSFRKYNLNFANKWLGHKGKDKFAARNPFFVGGDYWKTQRADALSGLTSNKLSLAYPIWQGTARKLRQHLNEKCAQCGSAELETKNLAYRTTLDIMCDFLWGIDSGNFADDNKHETVIMEKARSMLEHTFTTVGYYFLLTVVPFANRFYKRGFFPESTDRFFSQLTKDAIALRLRDSNRNRSDFLNYALQLQEKKKISHDDVMGLIMITLLDGYETAGTSLGHTLFYLAQNPRVQQKLRDEILENLNDDEFLPFDVLNSLPYLDQCVHETLRLITPIPIITRICTEATELEFEADKRVLVQPGTHVNVPAFSFHHDADFFPQPYTYNPDRFDHGAHLELAKQGVFMPFGSGPRICLGMRTGLLEVKTAVVEILRSYNLKCCARTIEEKKPDAQSFVLGLAGDFWLEYERIK